MRRTVLPGLGEAICLRLLGDFGRQPALYSRENGLWLLHGSGSVSQRNQADNLYRNHLHDGC